MTELPVRFRERMKTLLGEEYEAFEASYDKERVQGLRLNALKAEEGLREGWEMDGAEKLADYIKQRTGFTLERIGWAKEGYYYGSLDRPGKHPYHDAGVYYIQEPSAMAAVELLDPKPGDRVLDLCAAPGGKSSHMASRLKGTGFLLSNEIHPARARILSQNMERMGVKNAVVSNEDPERLSPAFKGFFDKILVDAPCSGEGMFRKDEEARLQWSEEHVRLCAGRQAGILDEAAKMLRAGGRLVYSTCTFAPEENEGTIFRFLERHGEFQVEKVTAFDGFSQGNSKWAGFGGDAGEGAKSKALDLGLDYTWRIMPHKLEGEGHYIAVLKKCGQEQADGQGVLKRPGFLNQKKNQDLFRDYERFLRDSLMKPEEYLGREEYVLFGEQLYLLPPQMPDMSGLKILRPGLHMGAFKKNRFEPSHALALALKKGEVKQSCELEADGPEVERYLKGEAPVPENGQPEAVLKGWALVCTDGFSLGWCKGAGGRLKNHYPKGLRHM